MKRLAALTGCLVLFSSPGVGQQPTLSPAVRGQLQRDTTLTMWFFGNRAYTLESVRAAVDAVGGSVRHQSRWLHAVSADVHTSGIRNAQQQIAFRHLQPVARVRGTPERGRPTTAQPLRAGGAASHPIFGEAETPVRLLNLFPLIDQGIEGLGVRIAILDTGFETQIGAFASANVIAEYDFVFDDPIVRNEPADVAGASTHGTQVWSLLAADVPNTIRGVARRAEYLLAKTEDVRSETRVEEDNWVAALEWADSIGVDVVSSSVNYLSFDGGFSYQPSDLNGDIAVTTVAADSAVARGIVVVASIGNRGAIGFRSLLTPADGDSVITVGAQDTLGLTAFFSGRGPTADGRIKPDLMATGVDVFVVDPESGTGFSRINGTSFSTPLIAGAAALMREVHPSLDPVVVRDALRRTGTNRVRPDSISGWGRPDGAAAAYYPLGVVVLGPTDSVLTSVTPTISYSIPQVAGLALPVAYRVVVATDSSMTSIVLDTITVSTRVMLLQPLRPGDQLTFDVTVTSNDSVALSSGRQGPSRTPDWATLTTLSDSAGSTIREFRPTFTWTSPDVAGPAGTFTYDITIVRDADALVELEALGLTDTSFVPDRDLERNTPYRWQVTSHLAADTATTESLGTFLIVDDSAPAITLLFQNFPNPFPNRSTGQPATCVWFDLAVTSEVRLDILDIRGHPVRTLIPNDQFPSTLPPGRYGRPPTGGVGSCDPAFLWDGSLSTGAFVPRGIYLIRLKTDEGTFFKRAVFMGRGF